MTDYETLDVDHRDDGVSYVTIERPDKLNALNPTVLSELEEAVTSLDDREGLQVAVLRGEGRAFVAGADIASMAEMSPEDGEAFMEQGHATMKAVSEVPAPVIAAVDGFALGGGLELAVACDLIYASTRATFGVPEVKLGIIPGFGGTQRLARFVGWHRARDLVFSGRNVDADSARQMGLALDVFDPDEFDERVAEIAATIASRGPLAIRAAKKVMAPGSDRPLEAGLEAEKAAFRDLFDSEDRREGMRAFVDSRDPDFEGR